MKKASALVLLSCLVFLVTSHQSLSQSAKSCCSKPGASDFAMLGGNDAFKASHLAPLPFKFVPAKGKMITLKAADGSSASAFEIKANEPTNNYLFVFQEWWGLNDYIKQEAENLSEELTTVNVIAIDLYDGRVATNADDAGKFMQETSEERIRIIISAFIKYAGTEAKIQTIGWCYGGGWSLQASLMAGNKAKGCVIYYGMPEKDKTKLKKLAAPVLGIFATKDGWINPDVVSQFEKDLKETGKTVLIKSYDADHAFANPSNPKFNKEAMEDAHAFVVKFLREHL